jgi:hypothetical protein
MPWLQGAQGNSSRRLQGTWYGTGIRVPDRCALVGGHSHGGRDTPDHARVWKGMSIEGTEPKLLNRNRFFS